MASRRLIPVPDLPPCSAQLPPEPLLEDKGQAASPFDRERAFFQAPVPDSTNYDQLSHG